MKGALTYRPVMHRKILLGLAGQGRGIAGWMHLINNMNGFQLTTKILKTGLAVNNFNNTKIKMLMVCKDLNMVPKNMKIWSHIQFMTYQCKLHKYEKTKKSGNPVLKSLLCWPARAKMPQDALCSFYGAIARHSLHNNNTLCYSPLLVAVIVIVLTVEWF